MLILLASPRTRKNSATWPKELTHVRYKHATFTCTVLDLLAQQPHTRVWEAHKALPAVSKCMRKLYDVAFGRYMTRVAGYHWGASSSVNVASTRRPTSEAS